jgi:predicted GNAT family acetyltransferase
MKITIRRATKAELHIIKGLDFLCFGDDDSELTDKQCNRAIWWLAFADGEPVAYTGAYIHDTTCMFLERTGVLNGFRGQGLQKRLIQRRVAYARRKKITEVYTYTAIDNWPSMNSLVSQGFRFYEPEWDYANSDVISYLYLKKTLTYE